MWPNLRVPPLLDAIATSVAERVELPIGLDQPPPVGEAVRLEDQEKDNDDPEDAVLEAHDQKADLREDLRERSRSDRQKLRQEGHEDGAEDGAQDASEPADDDHGEVVDRLR